MEGIPCNFVGFVNQVMPKRYSNSKRFFLHLLLLQESYQNFDYSELDFCFTRNEMTRNKLMG